MLYQALLILVPAVVIIRRGCRAVGRDDLEQFSRTHALAVTVPNGRAVLQYLARGRYYRAIGATAGYLVAVCIGITQGSQWPVIGVLLGLAGYFAGAFATEVGLARRRSTVLGTASLVPRRIDDYVDSWATRWPLYAVAASVAVAFVHIAAARDELLLVAALLPLAVVAVAATVRMSLRYVASRPQPLEAPDLLAADEAIRSASCHVLAGTGTAVASLVVAVQLWALAGIVPWGSVPGIGGVIALGFALGAWRDLSNYRFRVRRLANLP